MKTFIANFLMLMLLAAMSAGALGGDRAVEIHGQWLESVSRSDIDAAMSLLTNDAVYDDGAGCSFPFMCVGPEGIRPQVESMVRSRTQFSSITIRPSSAGAIQWTTARFETRSDAVRALGVERIVQSTTAVVRGNRIVTLRMRGDGSDGATAKFLAAQPRAPLRPQPPTAEPHGRFVDIGGRKMYMECVGTGSPTVVFESGYDPVGGASGPVWDGNQPGARPNRNILNSVGTITRACSYDRAGIGLSDRGPTPRTGIRVVEDLRTLLQRAGEHPPYVLVGFSLGGPLVYLFAGRHPDEVGGIVLVDPSVSPFGFSERLWEMLPATLAQENRESTNGFYARAANPRAFEGGWDLRALDAQVRGTFRSASLPDVPIVVLTAGMPDVNPYDFGPGWTEELIAARERLRLAFHSQLAKTTPRGRQVFIDSSEHLVFHFAPLVLATTVREVVETVRSNQRQGGRE